MASITDRLAEERVAGPAYGTAVGEPAAVRLGSRISGAAIWTGFAVGMAAWILLELVLFATDLTGFDAGVGDADTSSWFWNGVAAVVAFGIGGYVAGLSARSWSAGPGLIHGAAVWAVGLIGAILLTGLVGGFGFGALGDVFGFEQALQAEGPGARVSEQTVDDFREAAAWAAGFVALTLATALGGGLLGAKTPRRGAVEEPRARTEVA